MLCVYRMYDENNRLLYVGRSISASSRLHAHERELTCWKQVSYISIEHHDTDRDAAAAEANAIVSERPLCNISLNEEAHRLAGVRTYKGNPSIEAKEAVILAVRRSLELRDQGLTLQKISQTLKEEGLDAKTGLKMSPSWVFTVTRNTKYYKGSRTFTREKPSVVRRKMSEAALARWAKARANKAS